MNCDIVKVTPKERRWTIVFAITLMLATTIPYILGFANAGTDWHFTGFVFGVEDGNSYIAKMLSGANGDWLFFTPYTALTQNGVIAFLPYILLGKLSSFPGQHEQLVVLFHLFRIFAGVLSILATYEFIAIYLAKVKSRRAGVIIVSLGGGVGWLLVLIGKDQLLGSLPLEFYSPESFGFLALFGLPHLALARAFLLWGFRIYLVRDKESVEVFQKNKPVGDKRKITVGVISGVLFVGVGLAQPLTVVIGWTIILAHIGGLFFWQLYRWKYKACANWLELRSYLRRAVWTIGISSPIVIYTTLSFSLDPFLKQWTAQNIILSPHPLHYLIAYGLLVPFVIGGAYFVILDNPWRGWFPVVWVLLLPLFAYAPYNLQRRLPEGVWVVIVVLAVKAIEGPSTYVLSIFWERLNNLYRRCAPVLLLSVLSSLLLFGGGIRSVFNVQEPIFRPNHEVEALKFLNSYVRPEEVVLSAYDSGNVIPAWAPVRVVIGHGPESVKLEILEQEVKDVFYNKNMRLDQHVILKELGVKYIFWGPNERSLGDWNPSEDGYLYEIYNKDGYQVFEVEAGKLK